MTRTKRNRHQPSRLWSPRGASLGHRASENDHRKLLRSARAMRQFLFLSRSAPSHHPTFSTPAYRTSHLAVHRRTLCAQAHYRRGVRPSGAAAFGARLPDLLGFRRRILGHRGQPTPCAASTKTCPEICPELSNSEAIQPHSATLKRPYLTQMPCKWATCNEGVGGSSPPAGLRRSPGKTGA
jgi:hypothetical protein